MTFCNTAEGIRASLPTDAGWMAEGPIDMEVEIVIWKSEYLVFFPTVMFHTS